MKPNIVCIGGGTGQSEILRGLKEYDCNITGIVAVTDSGRSTGVIRRNFDIPAPGDLRNCLIALSDSEPLFKDVLQYRFDKGEDLKGMSMGNLLLTAMTKVEGSLSKGIKHMSEILRIHGKVIPSTEKNTHVCAELEDGSIVEEELNVRAPNKSKIKKIFLKDEDAEATKDAINAVKKADLIVIGPGSLYTSVLVHFLLPGLRKAMMETEGKKVFVSNMITQAGQTDGYSASEHVNEASRYCGGLDYVLLHKGPIPREILKEYEKEGGYEIKKDKENIRTEIIERDILKKEGKKAEWNKVSSIRHDPGKTADALMGLVKKEVKGLILAAGNGTRMKPFSLSKSKTMIPFLGKPLLAHHVDEMLDNGIEDITIVCNKDNIRQIRSYFANNYTADIKFVIQEKQRGPADAIYSAREHIKHSIFILKYGDSISSDDETRKILDKHRDEKNVLTLRRVEDPSEYGIIEFEGEKIKGIKEKPKENAPSNLANVGLSIINADVLFNALEREGIKPNKPPQAYLMENSDVEYWITEATRVDLGRAWNILEVNRLMLRRFGGGHLSNNIGNAEISRESYVSPRAVIADDVKIEGYCSIDGYIGKGTRIRDSVVMRGTKIGKDCFIDASVLGEDNTIGDNFRTESENPESIYVKGRFVNPNIRKAGLFTGENVTIEDNITSKPGKMVFPYKLVNEDIVRDKLIRAILFDADNTIYRTKEIAEKADMEAMKELSDDPAKAYERWKEIVKELIKEKDPEKRTREYSYARLAEALGSKNHNKAHERFKNTIMKEIRLNKGFREALPLLKNYLKIVFSEDNLTKEKLKALDIINEFDMVITSPQIGKMKPSKEYYRKVFERFNLEADECVIIGDDFDKDLAIPKEMNATTIIFGEDERADHSIQDFKELPEIMKGI
ncbi:MAG: uridine diphosphate-N-acetylglucosamine-binding protein YvcK [Nanobdellota archaeon]